MPTPTKGRRMGGSSAHQRHMLANLATALFEHGKITTTEARARRLRPFAEHLITFAKRGDLHARRQVLGVVTDKSVVHTLFTDIGPSFASRDGGYTRITKIGPRKGDNAALAVIELVREEAAAQPRRRRARRAQPATGPAGGRSERGRAAATAAAVPDAAAPDAAAPDVAAPDVAAAEVAVQKTEAQETDTAQPAGDTGAAAAVQAAAGEAADGAADDGADPAADDGDPDSEDESAGDEPAPADG